jgi:FKBP-type peptidyl-prolyl cis-trans isomerase
MKKITTIVLALALIVAVQACKIKTTEVPEGITKGQIDTISMALGVYFADMIKGTNLSEVNYSVIFKTMKQIRDGKDIGITPMQVGEIYQNYMMKKTMLLAEQNIKKGAEFLSKNKTKEGVIELPSGLQYKILEEGTGIQPEAIDTVVVHYTGTLIDGTEFDTSTNRGGPATFPLNGVIQGWIEGIQLLKEGTKAMLYIPSDLAYGANGNGPVPGNATLIFEVELLQVKKAAQ